MGGHGDFHTVKFDPAVERWNYMREHTYHHFKMTRPIANKILAFGLVIPASIFAIAQYTDERWNFAGARKNELTTQRGTFINTKPAEAEDDE